MKPILEVENLAKFYAIGAPEQSPGHFVKRDGAIHRPFRRRRPGRDRVWALRDVSFTAMPGDVIGVIGRNGAGKSTLLKILSRITDPTEGCVKLYGRVGSLWRLGRGSIRS